MTRSRKGLNQFREKSPPAGLFDRLLQLPRVPCVPARLLLPLEVSDALRGEWDMRVTGWLGPDGSRRGRPGLGALRGRRGRRGGAGSSEGGGGGGRSGWALLRGRGGTPGRGRGLSLRGRGGARRGRGRGGAGRGRGGRGAGGWGAGRVGAGRGRGGGGARAGAGRPQRAGRGAEQHTEQGLPFLPLPALSFHRIKGSQDGCCTAATRLPGDKRPRGNPSGLS